MMKLIEQIERLNRLNELIRLRQTGSPQQLARKMDLSTSMIFKLIEELKLRTAPIEYSRQLGTYYYKKPFCIRIQVDFIFLDQDEAEKISAGFAPAYRYLNRLPARLFLY